MPRKNAGFSIIELLIAMALFLTVILITTDIFVSVTQRQKTTLDYERALNELRYNLTFIEKIARTNELAFDLFADGMDTPEPVLIMRDKDKMLLIFYLSPNGCADDVAQCLHYFNTAQGDKVLSSKDLGIDFINFYIKPDENPNEFDEQAGAFLNDEHPLITIVAQGFSPQHPDKKINIQTTFSSRIYGR